MSAALILHDLDVAGVSVRLSAGGRLTLVGHADAVARVTDLVRKHRADIVNMLGAASAVPDHVREFCILAGYNLAEWTPAACRGLLDLLENEWPDLRVNGWHGCDYPKVWSVDMCLAVQSVYVRSIQDQGGVQ